MRQKHQTGSLVRQRPMAGKYVVIVGGDPIAAKIAAIFRTLGPEGVQCCPGFDEERRCRQAVGAADVVVAITAYMPHCHRDIVKRRHARNGLQVIWVNHLGIQALQRALGEAL